MTHVFIVNDKTFKYHLEYMFAGTGAKDKAPTFLTHPTTDNTHPSTERNLVGMIADISRLRVGDEVVFYLTGCAKFYGFFRVKQMAFADVGGVYLFSELGKNLTFRVLLESSVVYAEGVTEHEYLDCLDGIAKPYEMCWSLIYRKLKGNRGCTAIFDYEADKLKSLIQSKNNGVALNGNAYSYDNTADRITVQNTQTQYSGVIENIAIKERLLKKTNSNKAFEVHLQAYIMQNIESLLPLIGGADGFWFGNEVSCGVGMQRIDIMTVSETASTVNIFVVELKHDCPYKNVIRYQLPWYIKWCSDYVAPNFIGKKVTITPVVLARKFADTHTLDVFKDFAVKNPLSSTNAVVSPTRFVSFSFNASEISFKEEF